MKRLILMVALLVLGLLVGYSQAPNREKPERLPSGRLQSDVILEADHKKSLEDAEELLELAEKLRDGLAEDAYTVLSVDAVRATEKIEKLAKQIRNRMQRF